MTVPTLFTLPCQHTWDDPYLPSHATHRCVFTTAGPHTRHECRCGLNTYEAPA